MGKNVVYATFSTWVTPTVAINKGEAWDADDPVVRSHPDWFTDDPAPFARRSSDTSTVKTPVVEQATAAPGEQRATPPKRRGRPPRDAQPDSASE